MKPPRSLTSQLYEQSEEHKKTIINDKNYDSDDESASNPRKNIQFKLIGWFA